MTPESASDRSHLGELLVAAGFVSEEDVHAALAHQRMGGELPLGEILVERGVLSRLALAQALGEQLSGENRHPRRAAEGEEWSDHPGAVTGEHLAELREAIAELRELVSALEAAAGAALMRARTADADLHRLVEELTARLDGLNTLPVETAADSAAGEAQATAHASTDRAKWPASSGPAAASREDRIERPPLRPMREPLPASVAAGATRTSGDARH